MPTIYRFEDFELDEHCFELRRLGATVSVQPKVLRVLFHLVANHERSVLARELLELVWPGEAVTRASVKRAIAGARRALGERGDDAESSIRTVRGHGYRFVRDVYMLTHDAVVRVAEPQRASAGISIPAHLSATLDRALTELASGLGQQLSIYAEPGLGKSTLLREVERRAREHGALVLRTRCTDLYDAPPLWGVLQMLREAADGFDPALFKTLMQSGGAPVASSHPAFERRELTSNPPAALSPVDAFQFLIAFVALVKRTAATRPVVLLLDDLHHADAATLQLVAALPHQLEHTRVLVAGTLRPFFEHERAETSGLRRAAAALSSHSLELTGFSEHELGRYVSERLGAPLPASVCPVLHDWTAGNPRLCESVVQWAVASGEVDRGDWWLRLDQCAQSAVARAAVERQLAALAPSVRELLQSAAVFERGFSAATLARAEEIGARAASTQLMAASAIGVVRLQREGAPVFCFTQRLVREVLYAQMPLAERARRHLGVGIAIELEHPTALQELASHFYHAAPTEDEGRAVRYARLAARASMQSGAYEDAVVQLDRALQRSASCRREQLSLMLDKSEALAALGAFERAREATVAAASHARELGDVDAMVAAAKLFGRFSSPACVATEHLAMLQAALAALSDGDSRRAALEALLARAQVWSRSPGRGERANAALSSARNVRDAAERCEALVDCLHALADPEFLPQRLEIAEELEATGHQHGERKFLVASAAARVWAYAELGDMSEVDANISALSLLAEHASDPLVRWQATVFRAMRSIVAARLEDATGLACEALELGTKLGVAYARRTYSAQVGGIWRLQGRLREAAELVRDVSLRHPEIAGWQAALAGIEAELGRVEHGREVLRRLLDRDLALLRGDPFGLGALAPAADLCAQVGDAAQARLLYDALLPYADRHGVVSMGINTHGPLARHLGRLAFRMQDAARAELHFKRAIEASEQSESPTFTSLSCLGYAQMLIAEDRPGAVENAALLTARAFQLAYESKLWIVVERAKALSKQCAFRFPRALQPRAASES